jgi:hypothetical protein
MFFTFRKCHKVRTARLRTCPMVYLYPLFYLFRSKYFPPRNSAKWSSSEESDQEMVATENNLQRLPNVAILSTFLFFVFCIANFYIAAYHHNSYWLTINTMRNPTVLCARSGCCGVLAADRHSNILLAYDPPRVTFIVPCFGPCGSTAGLSM